VSVFLAHEQKIRAGCEYGFGQWLATEQSIAQIDRAQVLNPLAMRDQPAFGGIALAILLLGSILCVAWIAMWRKSLGTMWRKRRRVCKVVV
jgi:uncharacterized protein (DUF2062 family)